jgi:hypothetical protein
MNPAYKRALRRKTERRIWRRIFRIYLPKSSSDEVRPVMEHMQTCRPYLNSYIANAVIHLEPIVSLTITTTRTTLFRHSKVKRDNNQQWQPDELVERKLDTPELHDIFSQSGEWVNSFFADVVLGFARVAEPSVSRRQSVGWDGNKLKQSRTSTLLYNITARDQTTSVHLHAIHAVNSQQASPW